MLRSRRTTGEAAVSQRGSARDMYQRGLDIIQELRSRGILDDDEAKEIDTVAHKIAECDAFLAE